MKLRVLTRVLWWIFAAGRLAALENHGGSEVEVVQGGLSRWQVWASPQADVEARFWWAPDRGGSAWLRWDQWQLGPLTGGEGAEGTKAWVPGGRLVSGNWGLDFDGRPVGGWAIQTPRSFEAGAQLVFEPGFWVFAAGADRRWNTEWKPETLWTDEWRAGVSAHPPNASFGVETLASRPDGQRFAAEANGRASWTTGRWTWGTHAAWSETDRLYDASLRWKDERVSVTGLWSNERGEGLRAGWSLNQGLLWTGRVDCGQRAPIRPTLTVANRASGDRWKLSWALEPEARQVWTGQARLGALEAEAEWRVTGNRLGWFGNESRFRLTLRWTVA